MPLFRVKTFQIFLLGSDLDDERLEKFDDDISTWIRKNEVREVKDIHSSINPNTNEYIVTLCYVPGNNKKAKVEEKESTGIKGKNEELREAIDLEKLKASISNPLKSAFQENYLQNKKG